MTGGRNEIERCPISHKKDEEEDEEEEDKEEGGEGLC